MSERFFLPMINYEEKFCVKCGACVNECEFGGIKFVDGEIIINENSLEDWVLIAEICPVGALKIKKPPTNGR